MINIYNQDCLEAMKKMDDNSYELAIVDPPYGIGISTKKQIGYKGFNVFKSKEWDNEIPSKEYFDELFRVSKNQIVFGGNYFDLPPTRCFLIWDKGEGFYNRTYAEAELAWTSFDKNVRIFKHDPLAKGDYKGKIHPTQKPVKLYTWILNNYAKEGDRILDTHLGSGSIAIACHNLGFDLDGYELDVDYYEAATKRLKEHQRQLRLF